MSRIGGGVDGCTRHCHFWWKGIVSDSGNEGVDNTDGVMFLPWTALDRVLTGYDYGPGYFISHGLVIRWHYHMYDTDSFLGSL